MRSPEAFMKKRFETELPGGYAEALTVDAKDKKTSVLLTVASLLLSAAVFVPALLIIRPTEFFASFEIYKYFLTIAAMLAYIVLHELTHGAAYKLLTRRKLTFGVSLTVAYCGVPDIWVYRSTALISLLAPFTVFSVIFTAATALLSDPVDKIYAAFLLALHAGGCVGDLYDTALYLFKLRDPRTLMRDTGPKQTFYVPSLRKEHGDG